MTYPEALRYLNSFVNYEKKGSYGRDSFKLDRMRKLCSLLGSPQKDVRAIHVAGTKGKGSTSAIIQSILASAGYRVGLYTSPHLVSFRERIKVGRDLISRRDVCAMVDAVRPALGAMGGDEPSFFEVYTAIAFLYFKAKKADFAVYEAGLGGRLDATNVVDPLVCVLTPVSYDHTAILGDTLDEIAREKAGIVKPGSICVSAPQEAPALKAIEGACALAGAELVLVGRNVGFSEESVSSGGEIFSVSGLFDRYENLHMKLLGYHQVVNAATAITAVEALRLGGVSVAKGAVRKGVGEIKWPGRLEVVRKRSPRIILDGAQNGASADALARSVRRIFKYDKLTLVLGVSKDKDVKSMLKELVPVADSIILAKSEVAGRAMEPEDIRAMITPKSKYAAVTDNVAGALELALRKAGPSDIILVTGSLFVVGEARRIILKGEYEEE